MGATCSKADATVHELDSTTAATTAAATNKKASSSWTCCSVVDPTMMCHQENLRAEAVDPVMYDLCRKSLHMILQAEAEQRRVDQQQEKEKTQHVGQYHLLYKQQQRGSPNNNNNNNSESSSDAIDTTPTTSPYSTRLIVRKRSVAQVEEGTHGTHLYAIRYPPEDAKENNKIASASSSGSFQMQEQCPSHRKEAKQKKDEAEFVSMLTPTQQVVPTELLQDFFQPATMKKQRTKQTSKGIVCF